MIAARGVSKAFGRRAVLHCVELELAAPGLVRVEGANGAGKSTLLYAYKPKEVRGSLGITALLLCPITAWLAVAVSHSELAFAVLAALAVVAAPLFALAPVLSPAAWTADAMLGSGTIAGLIALAVHAAALTWLAALALRRIP